jgi:hypothetical protein
MAMAPKAAALFFQKLLVYYIWYNQHIRVKMSIELLETINNPSIRLKVQHLFVNIDSLNIK